MVNSDWPPEVQEQWQRIADAVEEPCGACRGGTLRLWRVTVETLLLVFANRYTAITRCDQCATEMAQSTDVLDIDVARGHTSLRFPQERREPDANRE